MHLRTWIRAYGFGAIIEHIKPRTFLYCCWLVLGSGPLHAQWQVQESHTMSDFRGLCAVDQDTAWASGSKGTYIRTMDGGTTWQVGKVPGAEELDFRDVEALDSRIDWLLSIGHGPASRIYNTVDGGSRWTLQFQNNHPEAFFDAVAFWARETTGCSSPLARLARM
jgi:photosystem II stability/assembly factor-like uncharacterized protein